MLRLVVLLIFSLSGMHAQARAPLPAPDALDRIAPLVQQEIADRRLPGAVVLIGDENGAIYRHAFGEKAVQPEREAMSTDTIFDLASLTKVIATTTAVMQLTEAGKLQLDAPVARYWPDFAANGKAAITVRELLTHYSGLRADLDLQHQWSGSKAARRLILQERPLHPAGSYYLYSDINFAVLGILVERASGQSLDEYCRQHIFKPLDMLDTDFRPQKTARIAPTEWSRRGVVHDPTAYRMGGVAGHAGLFSTADDLARFAQMMLAGGRLGEARILSRESIALMTVPQSPKGQLRLRGLGWDVAAPFAANSETLPPVGAYGHTGYTGTSLWIDPVSGVYAILLSNRVHPDGRGDVKPLRDHLAAAMGEALDKSTAADIAAARPELASYLAAEPSVMSGLDVLASRGFTPLSGKHIGLITNHTGRDRYGRRNVDLLRAASGVKLVALFSPEHGLEGKLDDRVSSGSEPVSGLPIYSLYGKVRKPTAEMLKGIDALVFDIQDAGARFYTYTTTMAYAMEAAAASGIPIYVLDRPNPINAATVQGPMLESRYRSFTGYFPLPVRYGMTAGELARFFNDEAGIGADLRIIPMRGYQRSNWYDDTGMPWIAPSPNLRTPTEAVLYPGVALLEGANVSVGRGTDTPFELVGAPWISSPALLQYLESRALPGVQFAAADFTPESGRFQGQRCRGIRIAVTDRNALDTPELGIEIIAALQHLHPDVFRLDQTLESIGSQAVVDSIRNGDDPHAIVDGWHAELQDFLARRSRYLIY